MARDERTRGWLRSAGTRYATESQRCYYQEQLREKPEGHDGLIVPAKMADKPTSKVVGLLRQPPSSQLSNVNEYGDEQLLWSDEELDDVTSAYNSNGMSFNAYSSVSTSRQKHHWLSDTGATHRMCNDITSFRTFKKWSAQVDFGGEDTDGKVIGSGHVLLRLHSSNNSAPNHLTECSLYSDIEKNLLSSYSLGEKGLTLVFEKIGFVFLKPANASEPVSFRID
ncbi:hypothetical protein V1519DRAFT_501165 [Lipomyces tetrasporus]